MADWKIERRGGGCADCERGFEDGERHISALRVLEGELTRSDVCAACWPAARGSGDGDTAPESLLFWWRTRHYTDKKRTVQLDLTALEELFVELEGREEENLRELRYVLCLLLMRKRRVKVERIERGPKGESFIVKRPRRDARFQVFVFDFTPERMAELRTQLQAIFDGAESVTPEGLDPAGSEDELPGEAAAGEADPQADGAADAPGETAETAETAAASRAESTAEAAIVEPS